MYNIIKYIDFSKFDVSIITFIPEKENNRFQDFTEFPIKIHQISSFVKLSPLKIFRCIKKLIIQINPDILHAHCPRSLYLMPFLPSEYKRVYTIHIYPGLQQKILYGNVKGTIVNYLNNFFTKYFVHLPIGCAESVSSLYKINKGWHFVSIPNGTSLPLCKKSMEFKSKLREKFGLKANIPYFIFIGRFSKEKNPQLLVNAFRNRKDIGLILLGSGPLWDTLKQKQSENILMPGFKTNVYEYLIASDYYISASEVEGLANTLLESMTIGLPVLLSDIPSHHEVLSKASGKMGYIFNQKDQADLLTKIDKILRIDKRIAKREIKTILQKYYTAEKMSKSYQLTYREALLKQR